MRHDYQSAADSLVRAMEIIEDESFRATNNVKAGRLYRLTTLLFEDRLIAPVVDTLLSEQQTGFEIVSEAVNRKIAESIAPSAATLSAAKDALILKLHGLFPQSKTTGDDDDQEAVDKVIQWLNDASERFARYEDETANQSLASARIQELYWLMEEVNQQVLRPLANIRSRRSEVVTLEPLAALQDSYKVVGGAFSPPTNYVEQLRELSKEVSSHATIATLRSFHDQLKEILWDVPSPLPKEVRPIVDVPGEWPRIRPLVAEIIARLNLGPARFYVVDRARTFFEHFERVPLRNKLAIRGSRKAEDIVQEELERFIFAEGFFPIVHAEAAHGELDLLIPTYQYASRAHEAPLLVELKQAIDMVTPSAITDAVLRQAIASGRSQAEDYAKHVRTHTEWRDVEPITMLFYSSAKRIPFQFEDENKDVVFVYVGESTPSARRMRT